MTLDLARLRAAVDAHGQVWRVGVVETRGSVPREAGAEMRVWADGQDGTIGGGRLEWEAAGAARAGRVGVLRLPLGPALGQCCGGTVTLHVSEWTAERLSGLPATGVVAIRADGPDVARPEARHAALPALDGDRLLEQIARPSRHVFVWGAGHVGRAIATTLAPLPGFAISWVDDGANRFPDEGPGGVERVVAADMPRLAVHAPSGSEHLILTYSHEIDLALCHALLMTDAHAIGLIGSDTKWARFRSRLSSLGHTDAQISRIACPIGDPSLGKHPQAIAVGVAAALLRGGDMRR